jgi:diguanylate cyclase (GGDEF)-like protein
MLNGPVQTPTVGVATAYGAPLDVLVADDDASSRGTLEEFVVSLGHRCRSARDGEEAWSAHRAAAADVIMSDWGMPKLDGVELCRRVRALGADSTSYTHVVIVTGLADQAHRMEAMRAGADDVLVKPVSPQELEARLSSVRRITTVHRGLAARTQALRVDSERFLRIARLDKLTGAANRHALDEDLAALSKLDDAVPASLAMCDVDLFKSYNDTFGHLAGDRVLGRIAETMRFTLRREDAVYRFGGEEFTVLLHGRTLDDAGAAMRRVRVAIEALRIGGAAPPGSPGDVVTVSIGVAARGPDWLRRADEALYRAKALGRNRVEAAP